MVTAQEDQAMHSVDHRLVATKVAHSAQDTAKTDSVTITVRAVALQEVLAAAAQDTHQGDQAKVKSQEQSNSNMHQTAVTNIRNRSVFDFFS